MAMLGATRRRMLKDGLVAAALISLANGNEPIPLAAFSDGIKHWQDRHGKDYARYEPHPR
jgi:hypothetical protein